MVIRLMKACVIYLGLIILAAVAGCANVHVAPDVENLGDKAILFGRIVLVRDGEVGKLDAMGTQISLQRTDIQEGSRLVTELFYSDGRFYWSLEPGRYLLNISLNISYGESADLAFDIPAAGGAYYFGDLIISGKKSFGALNAPKIHETTRRFEDNFDAESGELNRCYPALKADIKRITVDDITDVPGRLKYFAQEFDRSPLCCVTLNALSYTKLVIDTSSTAELDTKQGVFAFPSGKSAVAAYELPQDDAPFVISIRSEVSDGGVPYRHRIFVPAVMLLDEHYAPVATFDTGRWRPTPASIPPIRGAALEGEVLIQPAEPRARFVVIYTTERLLSGGYASQVPGVIALPAGLLGMVGMNMVALEPWIGGTVKVGLRRQ